MDRLESMRVFVKVASLGSYARAADQLNLSTALVSRHVSALETRLGARLLNRSTRSVSVTESGHIYLERAKRIIDELEETEQMLTSRSRIPAGKLRIVAPVVFSQQKLVPVLRGYRLQNPSVLPELTLTEHNFDLVSQGYDVGIVPSSTELGATMVAKPPLSTTWTICATAAYLSPYGVPESPAQLANHATPTAAKGDANAEAFIINGPEGEARVSLKPVLVANDMEVLRQATLCEMGIGFLPFSVISRDLAEGRLVPLLRDYTLPTSSLQIVFPSRLHLPAKVRTFIDYVTDYFQSRPLESRAVS